VNEMSVQYDTATLSTQLSSKFHNMGEVNHLTEIIGQLPMIGFWSAMAIPKQNDNKISEAQAILRRSAEKHGNDDRFYPGFINEFSHIGEGEWMPFSAFHNYKPFSSLDTGVIVGINTWARQEIYRTNPELYAELFQFAEVSKLEHHSPLVLELAVAISIPTLPILLTYGLMRAVSSHRKMEAEIRIREREADIKDEELRQKKIQTAIVEEIYTSIKSQRGSNLDIPEKVIENAASFAVSSVSELGSSPLVDKITFGVSSKS
jgi:hypothetical protein